MNEAFEFARKAVDAETLNNYKIAAENYRSSVDIFQNLLNNKKIHFDDKTRRLIKDNIDIFNSSYMRNKELWDKISSINNNQKRVV